MAIEDFRIFLEKIRKRNGAKLMESTIERYIQFIYPYFSDLERLVDLDNKVELMNILLVKKRNIILYSAFMQYLHFFGVDIYDNSGIHKRLKKIRKLANSFNNESFLQKQILGKKEVKKLLYDEPNIYLRLLYNFMYDTACRRAEICKIKFKDIELMNPDSQKGRDMIKNGVYAYVKIHGKGGKTRFVVLQKNSFKLLTYYYGNTWILENKVFDFHFSDGKPYKDQEHALYIKLNESANELLNRKVNPHVIRHTSATHLIENGMPVEKLQKYLGHSNISTTMIYVHLVDRSGADAMKYYGIGRLEEKN